EAGEHGAQPLRQRDADQMGNIEVRRVDGPERRGDAVCARGRPRRDQSGKLLVAGRARKQNKGENAKAEGGCKTPLRPVTQRHHPLTLTQRYTHTSWRRYAAPRWRQCDALLYCPINLAIALIARTRPESSGARVSW